MKGSELTIDIPGEAISWSYTQRNQLWHINVTDNGAVTSYAPNALNEYSSVNGQSLGYDGNFNITLYAGVNYIYDAESHLVGGHMQATYDGLGRCVRRTVNGTATLFVYDGWNPIVEFDGAGNYRAWNLYGAKADEVLARWVSGVGNLWYHSDSHGNVFALLNNSAGVMERYSYDAFGKPKITGWTDEIDRGSGWYGNRFMFQGREWIPDLGIYDYRHRIYHPGLGRFLQSDPMGLQTEGAKLTPEQKALYGAGAPEAFGSSEMNLFRYCGDDPANKSDPLGLEVQGSLEYYIMEGTQGRGHMNFVLHDTVTGQTMVGRGMPSEPYSQSALRSFFNRPQESGKGGRQRKAKNGR